MEGPLGLFTHTRGQHGPRISVLVVALSLAFVSSSLGAEPWEGSWKLNTAKSPASKRPPPKNQTFTSALPTMKLSRAWRGTKVKADPIFAIRGSTVCASAHSRLNRQQK